MSTTAPTRRPPRARPGATIPEVLAAQLRQTPDPRDQLVLIAEHERRAIERSVAGLVGAAGAEDVVSEVIVEHLERHVARPEWTYRDAEGYHRLRASLRRAARNRAIDVTRRNRHVELLLGDVPSTVQTSAEAERTRLVATLDGAALYDAFRRLEPRDAAVLRIKLVEGGTFRTLADHLGVRSLNAAHKHYLRAIRAAQKTLDRYGSGGYCREYAPYLALATQESENAGGDHPLTALVGEARAREIQLHIHGDPLEPNDAGCHLCQVAGRRERAAVAMLLPPPVVVAPAGGPLSTLADMGRHAWDWAAGWLGALPGAGTGAPVAGGLVAKGAALAAAAVVVIGLPVTARSGSHAGASRPTHATTAPAFAAPAADHLRPRVAAVPTVQRKRKPAPAASTQRTNRPASTSPAPRRTLARTPNGGAAREFTPGPPG